MAQNVALQNEALILEARQVAAASEQSRIQQHQRDTALAQKMLEDERARFRQATAEQLHASDEAVGAVRQSAHLARQAAEAEAARRFDAEAEVARRRAV